MLGFLLLIQMESTRSHMFINMQHMFYLSVLEYFLWIK